MPRNPRVLIPTRAQELITYFINVSGLFARSEHVFLQGLPGVADELGQAAQRDHDDSLNARNTSELNTADRNALLESITNSIRQLRDYLLGQNNGSYQSLSRYGFSLIHSNIRSSGRFGVTEQKPGVIIPSSPNELIEYALNLGNLSKVISGEGGDAVDAFVEGISDSLTRDAGSARQMATDYSGNYELSQTKTADRNAKLAIMTTTLRSGRDFLFGIGGGTSQVLEAHGYSVLQSVDSRFITEARRNQAWYNLLKLADSNLSIPTILLTSSYGPNSDEYRIVNFDGRFDDTPPPSVSLKDMLQIPADEQGALDQETIDMLNAFCEAADSCACALPGDNIFDGGTPSGIASQCVWDNYGGDSVQYQTLLLAGSPPLACVPVQQVLDAVGNTLL